MKKANLIFLLLVIVLLAGCGIAMSFADDKLCFQNNADYDIYVLIYDNKDESVLYDAGLLISTVNAGDTTRIDVINTTWDSVMQQVKAFKYYCVRKDSADKYPSSQWGEHVQPIKKEQVTAAQLDSLNWVLQYP